jgi:hypothetical protein
MEACEGFSSSQTEIGPRGWSDTEAVRSINEGRMGLGLDRANILLLRVLLSKWNISILISFL